MFFGMPGATCRLELMKAFTRPLPGISWPGITSNMSETRHIP